MLAVILIELGPFLSTGRLGIDSSDHAWTTTHANTVVLKPRQHSTVANAFVLLVQKV
jgi:hypothetical protein